MTSVKWLIAVDMANALMGNVFVPEDIQEMLASKVNITPCCSSFILYLMFICEHGPKYRSISHRSLAPWSIIGAWPGVVKEERER